MLTRGPKGAWTLRFESGMLTFTVSGAVGQTAVIEAGTSPTALQTIATQVLTDPTWTFSDPDTSSFAKRFYRVGEEEGAMAPEYGSPEWGGGD
jgi:hypothetical protein